MDFTTQYQTCMSTRFRYKGINNKSYKPPPNSLGIVTLTSGASNWDVSTWMGGDYGASSGKTKSMMPKPLKLTSLHQPN